MNLSDAISDMILSLIASQGGCAEIARNELAQQLGCVPSVINYVISSRFTPENGYIVESRRGGGGYVRITRITEGRGEALMHVINSVGGEIDAQTCRVMAANLVHRELIPASAGNLMAAVISDNSLRDVSVQLRNTVRAAIFKQMLLSLI